MNANEVKKELLDLGQDWTRDSKFVDSVMAGLPGEHIQREKSVPRNFAHSNLWRWSLAVVSAASIGTVIFLGLWPGELHQKTVSGAMVRQAIQQAQENADSIQIVINNKGVGPSGKPYVMTIWVDRNRGVSRYVSSEGKEQLIELDDGKNHWELQFDKKFVSQSRSDLQLAKILEELSMDSTHTQLERREGRDIVESGTAYSCYEVTNLAPFEDGTKQRSFYFVDKKNQLYKALGEILPPGEKDWISESETNFYYDIAIPADRFLPGFPSDLELVDIEREIDQLADPAEALFSKTQKGLTYSVHRAIRVENGGLLVLASLRKQSTDAQLQDWNFTYQEQSGEYFRVTTASASHSTRLQWYLLHPNGRNAAPLHPTSGKTKFRDTVFRFLPDDGESEYLTFDIEVVIPPDAKPVSYDTAAKLVYEDLAKIPHLSYRSLETGVTKTENGISRQTGSPDETSLEKYQAGFTGRLDSLLEFERKTTLEGMRREIKRGRFMISVPGVSVVGMLDFGDEELRESCERKDLVVLYLEGTSVTDAGLEQLNDLKSLQQLSLAGTEITDNAVVHLKSLTWLKMLDVRETALSDRAIQELKASLPHTDVESGEIEDRTDNR